MFDKVKQWLRENSSKRPEEIKHFNHQKEVATQAGEPWVEILHFEINPANITEGAFELDWNEIFIARLMKAGYRGNDREMVEQWFKNICEGVASELYD